MASETGKACRRRSTDPRFTGRWMAGSCIDIGAGSDGLSRYVKLFPKITGVREWDLSDGDAQLMEGVADESFDTVHSSHTLEHMRDVEEALDNWWRILKPGGHLVVVVPDWELYEQGIWPSTFNPDHKHRFTTSRETLMRWRIPGDLVFPRRVHWELVQLLDFTYTPDRGRFDYSTLPDAEPAIEFVVRKAE